MSIFNFSAQTMYCWASVNTIQSHATTMSLMNGPFDVLFKLLACKTVNHFEKFGTYIILIGILIMVNTAILTFPGGCVGGWRNWN